MNKSLRKSLKKQSCHRLTGSQFQSPHNSGWKPSQHNWLLVGTSSGRLLVDQGQQQRRERQSLCILRYMDSLEVHPCRAIKEPEMITLERAMKQDGITVRETFATGQNRITSLFFTFLHFFLNLFFLLFSLFFLYGTVARFVFCKERLLNK